MVNCFVEQKDPSQIGNLANNEDPDEILHYALFLQGLPKWIFKERNTIILYSEIIAYDHSLLYNGPF